MTPCVSRSIVVLLLLTLGAESARAQRLSAPTFVFARYASHSASSLYAVRGFGPIGGFVAMVENPTTQYRELIGGVDTQIGSADRNLLLGVAYADVSDGHYLQTYFLPSVTAGEGRLSFAATVEWYEPLGRAGIRQLSANPASLELRVAPHLWLGAAATLDLAPGLASQHRIGPVAEWTGRWGTLHVEILDRSADRRLELRSAVTLAR